MMLGGVEGSINREITLEEWETCFKNIEQRKLIKEMKTIEGELNHASRRNKKNNISPSI